jgi:hypothetical protein
VWCIIYVAEETLSNNPRINHIVPGSIILNCGMFVASALHKYTSDSELVQVIVMEFQCIQARDGIAQS